jgi:DNA-binding transcriptional regulator YhcF (GntR family)
MKIDEFKKLEKKITGYNFNQSYKNVKNIMVALSYFGNLTSIFLAYFFMSGVITGAIGEGNTVFVFIASIIILAGIELLKRDIFDKFSIQYLKDSGVTKLVMPLLIVSGILISASFYSSLTGAKEFSSKSDQLELVKKDQLKEYSDSITYIYSDRMSLINSEVESFKETFKEKDNEQTIINKALQERGYLTRSEKERNNQLKEEKEFIFTQISNSENKLKEIKTERDDIIEKYSDEISKETDDKKKDNSKNSLIFIILSTIIEIVILAGVFFNQYYKFRSYKEFRNKIEKDPNYQKWLLYDQILNIVVTEETKINQKLPSNKAIIESCKVNDIIILPKDVTNFLKVLNNLGIIKSSGSAKYVVKTKEIAQEILRTNFNIE